MSAEQDCCQLVDRVAGIPSPFKSVIGLDWYDGMLTGLVSCGLCDREYAFGARAWDLASGLRAYEFKRLASGSFGAAWDLLASKQEISPPVAVAAGDAIDTAAAAGEIESGCRNYGSGRLWRER